MKKKVKIIQEPEKEISVEIMAQAIIDLSNAAKKLLNGKLKREAIITLIKDKTGIEKHRITSVLDELENLEKTWCQK
jgi:predicted DNA-binding ArsR family transcriptional regulator